MELKKITQLSWRRFLDTEAGRQGLLYLYENVPNIACGQPHEVQFNAGFTQGYRRCLEQITEILSIEQKIEGRADND